MSEIAETPTPVPVPAPDVQTVHEAYSFACMRCGYGWEQAYVIEHHVDGKGQPFIIYTAKGERVPSPLSNPNCLNCGGHVVRIMRAGQVSSVVGMLDQLYHYPRMAPGIAGPVPATGPGGHEHRRRGGRHAAASLDQPDLPGPVHVTEEERMGPLARLWAWLRRS